MKLSNNLWKIISYSMDEETNEILVTVGSHYTHFNAKMNIKDALTIINSHNDDIFDYNCKYTESLEGIISFLEDLNKID